MTERPQPETRTVSNAIVVMAESGDTFNANLSNTMIGLQTDLGARNIHVEPDVKVIAEGRILFLATVTYDHDVTVIVPTIHDEEPAEDEENPEV